MKCKSTERLFQEHRTVLRVADVLSEIARRAASGEQVNNQDIRGVVEIIRLFADESHQGKEEGALFPIFTASCDRSEVDPIRYLLSEHDEDRSLMHRMEDALLRLNTSEFADSATRLADMLRDHLQKEDNLMLEVIDKALSREDDERIVQAMDAMDRDFKQRDRLLHRLRMLEWKYLRKAA